MSEANDTHDDFDDYPGEPAMCDRCDGEGVIVTCCDDICVGQGYCMHGDGEEICPECDGEGEVW